MEEGKRYRWKIVNNGRESKLVEIAISIDKTVQNTIEYNYSRNHTEDIKILEQMSHVL